MLVSVALSNRRQFVACLSGVRLNLRLTTRALLDSQRAQFERSLAGWNRATSVKAFLCSAVIGVAVAPGYVHLSMNSDALCTRHVAAWPGSLAGGL